MTLDPTGLRRNDLCVKTIFNGNPFTKQFLNCTSESLSNDGSFEENRTRCGSLVLYILKYHLTRRVSCTSRAIDRRKKVRSLHCRIAKSCVDVLLDFWGQCQASPLYIK